MVLSHEPAPQSETIIVFEPPSDGPRALPPSRQQPIRRKPFGHTMPEDTHEVFGAHLELESSSDLEVPLERQPATNRFNVPPSLLRAAGAPPPRAPWLTRRRGLGLAVALYALLAWLFATL